MKSFVGYNIQRSSGIKKYGILVLVVAALALAVPFDKQGDDESL
jgi:hypothetical protein